MRFFAGDRSGPSHRGEKAEEPLSSAPKALLDGASATVSFSRFFAMRRLRCAARNDYYFRSGFQQACRPAVSRTVKMSDKEGVARRAPGAIVRKRRRSCVIAQRGVRHVPEHFRRAVFFGSFFERKSRKVPQQLSEHPAKNSFTTFCHQKVAPKVSAWHLSRERTNAVTERSRKTPLFARSLRAFHLLSALFPSTVQCGG